MIEVKNLTKKYGSHIAVEDLTFHVKKGEIYGFLGPNGAGKSTTMNLLTGYLGATHGKITINGFDVEKKSKEAKRSIGYLPEIPPLYQDMTVKEYMICVSQLKGIGKKERKDSIEEAMKMTGIAHVEERLIRNLSKGYKQRIGLAQAILGFPQILILDEPMVGLDPKQMMEMRDLIRSLGKKHTIILSSHILSEISALCDHIMIISKGRLVASDTPEELGRKMQGAITLTLTIKGKEERVQTIFSSMPELKDVKVEKAKEGQCNVTAAYKEEKEDVREKVFEKMALENMPILEMQSSKLSLEDVFLELTSEEKEGQL